MTRRWTVFAAVATLLATPVLAACGDDDDDAPEVPTVTLFEETISPNVSTEITT